MGRNMVGIAAESRDLLVRKPNGRRKDGCDRGILTADGQYLPLYLSLFFPLFVESLTTTMWWRNRDRTRRTPFFPLNVHFGHDVVGLPPSPRSKGSGRLPLPLLRSTPSPTIDDELRRAQDAALTCVGNRCRRLQAKNEERVKEDALSQQNSTWMMGL
ncbi:hypothetical protein DFJ73DRAFT_494090 [Zopfochytrium polystomum]|nr:hypothetical protein DFJ73DRAFT_494090 [Zopfochytrium polystomum]